MPSSSRRLAVSAISGHSPLKHGGERRVPLTEIYAINVFNERVQRQRLPKNVFRQLQETVNQGTTLDPAIADAVASAMRDWAVERGATHFTHWFQPMTGLTAEKHDSFLSLTGDHSIINEFTGSALIRGEPDASSFPSGGLRSTFEARGYTAWDPTSPAFLREGPNGLTLFIPTAFCSWTGEALDKKTPLLRSDEAVNRAACRLINMLGGKEVSRVYSTIGCEQEYFLVDRRLADLRPDLLSCGRTLFGARPPKGQELADNYFGAINERVLGFMQDLEYELWKLGIPVKTRHNEVAPAQFELAPLYSKATVAVDHNMLIMELMKTVADRHELKCLLHEKPFAGVNGSGKHTNWSLSDDLGNNLLEPGETPLESMQFMLFLTAIIRGVDRHADLLRVSVASSANDHRLGAHEAPPAIISIFLGAQLEGIVESLLGKSSGREQVTEPIVLGVNSLPPLPRDLTDRNRTSPFAFTGNKFEFRAVGSSQSAAYPATVLNSIVAESLNVLADRIEARRNEGPLSQVVQAIVAETLREHERVLFSGDNYSAEWTAEAERRGMPNLKDTASALPHFTAEHNLALFEGTGVLNRREAESRLNVLCENYAIQTRIEGATSVHMVSTMILPGVMRYQRDLAETINATRQALTGADLEAQESMLRKVTELIAKLKLSLDRMRKVVVDFDGVERGPLEQARFCREVAIAARADLRDWVDQLEELVDDEVWPLPKYREMLFHR
ncbi:MAG: glutamine synthetase III [Planctomycetes bacterium]|nr:glutamine synthetase III [Planctomycetota bacterium]